MSHSTVLVVLSDADVELIGLEDALAKALEKFDENKDTPRYVKLTRDQAIEKQRKEYEAYRDGWYAEYLADPEKYKANTHAAHYRYISEEFPAILAKLDDRDFLHAKAVEWEEDTDEAGNVYSTRNPHSKWDWYSIGGRWSGSVLNTTETIHHPARVITPTWTEEAWDELAGGVDYLQVKDLTTRRGTFAYLDKAGEWHERGRMGWWGSVSDETATPEEFDAQIEERVKALDPSDWLVVVDVHI